MNQNEKMIVNNHNATRNTQHATRNTQLIFRLSKVRNFLEFDVIKALKFTQIFSTKLALKSIGMLFFIFTSMQGTAQTQTINAGYLLNGGAGLPCTISSSTNGLMMNWNDNGNSGLVSNCSSMPSLPDMININSYYGQMLGTNYWLVLNGNGNLGLGINPSNTNFKLQVAGNGLFNSSIQIKQKLRINNTSLIANDFNSTTFPYSFSVDYGNSRFIGKVEIGGTGTIAGFKKPVTSAYNTYALSVNGNIACQKIYVENTDWADFVFDKEYKLNTLPEIEKYILANKHLPNMPSQNEIAIKGIDVSDMLKLQQQKIEELTLYIIDMQKQLDALKAQTN